MVQKRVRVRVRVGVKVSVRVRVRRLGFGGRVCDTSTWCTERFSFWLINAQVFNVFCGEGSHG